MPNQINKLFEIGDTVEYSHPVYGKGKGTFAYFDERTEEVFVYPYKPIKGIEYIVCEIFQIINTPF